MSCECAGVLVTSSMGLFNWTQKGTPIMQGTCPCGSLHEPARAEARALRASGQPPLVSWLIEHAAAWDKALTTHALRWGLVGVTPMAHAHMLADGIDWFEGTSLLHIDMLQLAFTVLRLWHMYLGSSQL